MEMRCFISGRRALHHRPANHKTLNFMNYLKFIGTEVMMPEYTNSL
jgi:hypothetical protein